MLRRRYRNRWRPRTFRYRKRRRFARAKRRWGLRKRKYNYMGRATRLVRKAARIQQRASINRSLTLYRGAIVRKFYRPTTFRFNLSDFNSTSAFSTFGHWAQDFQLNHLMDNNEINEFSEYQQWSLLGMVVTFNISRSANLVKFAFTGAPGAGMVMPWQYPALENSCAFNFFVAMFRSGEQQSACAGLTTHETFAGGGKPTNEQIVAQNKRSLELTGMYKRLTLKGNKQTFVWRQYKHGEPGQIMLSTPAGPTRLTAAFPDMFHHTNEPHGFDFNWWDYNDYIDPTDGTYKATLEITMNITSIWKFGHRMPVSN